MLTFHNTPSVKLSKQAKFRYTLLSNFIKITIFRPQDSLCLISKFDRSADVNVSHFLIMFEVITSNKVKSKHI